MKTITVSYDDQTRGKTETVTLPVRQTAAQLGHKQISDRCDGCVKYLSTTPTPSLIHHIPSYNPEGGYCVELRQGKKQRSGLDLQNKTPRASPCCPTMTADEISFPFKNIHPMNLTKYTNTHIFCTFSLLNVWKTVLLHPQ